jgi:hypothetical protein
MKRRKMADNENLDNTLARLDAAATETENILEELAMIFAELATQDYCPAVYRDGRYIGEVAVEDMVDEAIGNHVFPHDEHYTYVRAATLTIVEDMCDASMRIEDRDALYGLDDPENLKPPPDGSDDASPTP